MKNKLAKAINEKDVENTYREEFMRNIKNAKITSPYNIDGLLESKNIRSLLEFKYQLDLKNKLAQCNILLQTIYYLKKFETEGQKLPSTIFVGDIDECFALHPNKIIKYLASEIDWKIAPSEAYKKNPEILQAMVKDQDILPFVFDIDEKFSIKTIINKIKDLSESVIRKVRVTEHNITTIFDYFDKNVIAKKSKINTNQKANLFVQLIINTEDNYLHPKRKNILVSKSLGEVDINQNQFQSFFKHFEGDTYAPSEKETLTGFVDRLIEDSTRRKQGEFFTPTAFVDLAHKYIAETFGEDWKEKYIVWDCAWGTGNLTRDYKFKSLYASTLIKSDLDTAEQMNYNPEATKFQYDFLNDDYQNLFESKIPEKLKEAILEKKEILFL